MAIEEPVGFTADGQLVTAYRFTEADVADIGMAGEMYWASPAGQEQMRAFLDGLPDATITVDGYWVGGEPPC